MASTPDDPKTLAYWLNRGAQKFSNYWSSFVDNNIQLINKIRGTFKGISMQLAGELVRNTIKANLAATKMAQGKPTDVIRRSEIPINPNLFPEGRIGRRYRYTVQVSFHPIAGGETLYRTVFIDSPLELSQDTIEHTAYQKAQSLIAQSPGERGKEAVFSDYLLEFKTTQAWRSH